MIHPSYYELIDRINERSSSEESPVITSRYSIVLATSKRARQLTRGADAKVKVGDSRKLLSIAVEELYEGVVNIIPVEEQNAEAEAPLEKAPEEETAQN